MRVRTFFRNYMLIPVVLIPFFTIALFFLTWQGGLRTDIEKGLLPVLFALPVVISFLVIFIVLIVRLCRRLPVIMLLQALVIELLVVAAFFILDYKKSTWMLNQYLYQDKREALVHRLQSNPNPGEEVAAMIAVDTNRNFPQYIVLHDSEERLQNKRLQDFETKEPLSRVKVQRDCAGNLTVEFVYDADFLGSDYAVLYSDKLPAHSTGTSWDANGLPQYEEYITIDDYTVLDSISPNWYYVRCKSPWSGMFNFGLGGGGEGGGSTSGGCE